MTLSRAELDKLMDTAVLIDSPHVDFGPFLQTEHTVLVGINELHEMLLEHDPTAIKLNLQVDDKSLLVEHVDGGIIATFSMPW